MKTKKSTSTISSGSKKSFKPKFLSKIKINLGFKISFNAPVVLGIVAISLVATILNYVTFGKSNRLLFSTYRASLASPLTWLRAFGHVFGHKDWSHFAGNMSYLLLLGPMLEEKYSSRMLMIVTAITAFAAAVINYIFFPHAALLGASGVVFAFILLSSFTSFKEGEIPLTFILVAVIFIGKEVIDAVFANDNISHLGHIVGGVIGGIIGYRLNIRGSGGIYRKK
ncbi:MAG: rhomboid family intramembrane serine protease [Lachnospiraceae bacterium]|nr:rhomboid family intramembrane serine protease [Lachnospiraceae bacterium]